MVDFKNKDEIKRWLEHRPREELVVLAARAALRALPALATGIQKQGQERRPGEHDFVVTVVLPVFRATASPWVAGKYPSQGEEFRPAVDAAAVAARAAVDAAAVAARAVVAAALAARAAALAADAAFAADAASVAADAAFAADASALDQGIGASALAGRPLWPEGEPEWAGRAWAELKANLLAREEDWEVWTDWYEARLKGKRVRHKSIEIARVTLDEALWEAGPKAVNGELRRLIEAAKPARRDPVLVQRPSSHSFAMLGETIEATPVTERPLEPVLAEALAGEVRDKAAKTLASLTGNHADADVTEAVERLLEILRPAADRISIGLLLSRANTLAALAKSYADAAGGRERSIRVLVTDLATTLDDLLACYPGIQPINANRLALALQDQHALDVNAGLDAIAAVARKIPVVGQTSKDVLAAGGRDVEANEAALARTSDLDRRAEILGERGKKVAARLLDVTNFISAPAQKIASEFAGLGADTWRETRKTLPKAVARGVSKGTEKGLKDLVSGCLAPWTAIAAMVPSLGPHARKVKDIADAAREPEDDAPSPPETMAPVRQRLL